MNDHIQPIPQRIPWNKGKLVGQKAPLKLREVWNIRIRLQLAHQYRDLALFNLAIDSKLRGCDLVRLRVRDVVHGGQVVTRATVMQRKTGQPVRFEVTEQTRDAVRAWIAEREPTLLEMAARTTVNNIRQPFRFLPLQPLTFGSLIRRFSGGVGAIFLHDCLATLPECIGSKS